MSDCEAGNGGSRQRFKKVKTEHCKGFAKTVPKQGPQQPSGERPKATAPRKTGQSTGPDRGQTVQKQTAGRCQTRRNRAANDKLFVQQFTSETRAMLANASSAEAQPADSNAEAPAGKKARGNKNRIAHRNEAAGAPHACKSQSTQGQLGYLCSRALLTCHQPTPLIPRPTCLTCIEICDRQQSGASSAGLFCIQVHA